MKAKFRLYSGLSGDPSLLLTVETEDGYSEHCLWSCTGLFRHYFLARKKKKLLKKLELETGRKYTE